MRPTLIEESHIIEALKMEIKERSKMKLIFLNKMKLMKEEIMEMDIERSLGVVALIDKLRASIL